MDQASSIPCLDQESSPSNEDYINRLPTELLVNVFSLLPPRDQLEAREVCRRWAQVLSVSSSTFSNVTTFKLDPRTEAHSTLLSSGANWRRVQITGLVSTSESLDWFRSLNIGSSVRRLVFRDSVFTHNFLQSSLLEFLQLGELELINSHMVIEKEEDVVGAVAVGLWQDFLKTRLTSLTVEVGEAGVLADYLEMFNCPGSCLRKLNLRTTFPYDFYIDTYLQYSSYYIREEKLLKEIFRNFVKLRDFSLTARCEHSIGEFWSYFLRNSPQTNLHLRSLDIILPDPDTFGYHAHVMDLPKFLNFLIYQPELTSLSLPRIADENGYPELVISLPDHLETVVIGCVTAFRLPAFILKLIKVKNMTLYFPRESIRDFNHWSSVKVFRSGLSERVLPQLESLTVYSWPGRIASTLASSFPNLSKLVITCFSEEASVETVNDAELQIIVASLTHLTVLKLSSCALITDFGLAGIGLEEGASLLALRDAGLDLDSLHIARKGPALQDLQGLEELTLEGPSQISDVGVAFGLLGFKNLRHFHLATANKELTDWGLVRLAKSNPKLERMYMETSHLEDTENLENVLLAQLKSNGRWKRLHVSLRAHSEGSLKRTQRNRVEEKEFDEIMCIDDEIRKFDLAANGHPPYNEAQYQIPTEVYLKWRDETIESFKARYDNCNQKMKGLIHSIFSRYQAHAQLLF